MASGPEEVSISYGVKFKAVSLGLTVSFADRTKSCVGNPLRRRASAPKDNVFPEASLMNTWFSSHSPALLNRGNVIFVESVSDRVGLNLVDMVRRSPPD